MLVQTYFASTLPTWEDVYRQGTLYSTIYQERLALALAFVDALGLAPGSRALDIGCGPGFGTVALSKRGLEVTSVDLVPEMVAMTVQRAAVEGARVRGAVSDIRALPFASATYHLALVIGVTEWLDRLGPALTEVARVLAPGGHVVLSADNDWALANLLDPLQHPLVVPLKRALGQATRLVWPRPRALRTRGYSRAALDTALRQAGLVLVRGSTLGFGPFSFLRLPVVPDRLGHALHRRLVALADRGVPGLASAGLTHVIAAQKPLVALA